MSLEGNGNVMRLVADVYLSAGEKKFFLKKALRDVRLGNTLFPEVQSRDLDKAIILAAAAKVNWLRIFLKICHLAVAASKPGEKKDAFITLKCKVHTCPQPTNIY